MPGQPPQGQPGQLQGQPGQLQGQPQGHPGQGQPMRWPEGQQYGPPPRPGFPPPFSQEGGMPSGFPRHGLQVDFLDVFLIWSI